MRKPGTPLSLVDAEPLEPAVDVFGERRRVATVVVQDEHADASRLSIAGDPQDRRPSTTGGLAQLSPDRLDVLDRPAAQEGERDVELVTPSDPRVGA